MAAVVLGASLLIVLLGFVHGSFNTATKTAQLIVVLSPSVTDGGYEMVDVANEAPWNALRK